MNFYRLLKLLVFIIMDYFIGVIFMAIILWLLYERMEYIIILAENKRIKSNTIMSLVVERIVKLVSKLIASKFENLSNIIIFTIIGRLLRRFLQRTQQINEEQQQQE